MIPEAIEKLTLLLQGRVPGPIDIEKISGTDERALAELLNQLFLFVREIHAFVVPLSRGRLEDVPPPRPSNFLASPFKVLQSHLLHLTWQAKQVAKGDYSQRVDFMGDFSEAFNTMITSLAGSERDLRNRIGELEQALSHIRKLEDLLSICASCKKIRIDGANPRNPDSWVEIERYLGSKMETRFSHGICPACTQKLYPDFDD